MPANAPDPGRDDPLELHGVVPPMLTGFDADGALDLDRTVAHARFLVDRGVHGLFPLGTNGEFALLTAEERDRVAAAVADAVDEVPVIVGVGAPGTHATVARAERAAAAGVDGVVTVVPYYFPVDHEGAVTHYRRVAAAVDVPVYVYHIPSKTGTHLDRETVAAIAEIDGVVGLKDSSKDVPWFGQVIDDVPRFTHMVGSDSLLVPGLDLGCAGLVSAVANAFPEPVVELYDAYDAGDLDRARTLQSQIYELRRALKRGPYLAGPKTALQVRGHDAGGLRAPLRTMDDDQRAALAATLADLPITREFV